MCGGLTAVKNSQQRFINKEMLEFAEDVITFMAI